ncbi:MAG TPA: MATE family efflux transporter [Treponema sp.]|nr:MATE family efflux transporter [Treponema sp.]
MVAKKDGFYIGLFSLAFPIMIQSFINSLVNMVDTIMIGQLGTVAIAAVGLGNQIYFLLNMVLFGIVSGGAVFTAQYWGKKDIPSIKTTTGFCLTLVLAVGMLFAGTCFFFPRSIIGIYSSDLAVIQEGGKYLRIASLSFLPFSVSFLFTIILRSVERIRVSVISTVISLTLNVILNYLFIFGYGKIPAMGVAGAGLATVISRLVEMVIILTVSYVKKYPPAGTLRELFSFSTTFAAQFSRIAVPVILNEIMWGMGTTLQSVIFARTNTDAIAAFNITNTISNLTWVFYIGLANGVSVMIGKKIGEGDHLTAREYAKRIIRFAPLTAPAVAGLLFFLRLLIPFFFNVSPEALSYLNSMFILLAIAYPFRAFNITMIIGVSRAGGDTRYCAIYDLFFMWAIALPAAAIAAFRFGAPVWLIYFFVMSEEIMKVFPGLLRFKSGKWLHDVT